MRLITVGCAIRASDCALFLNVVIRKSSPNLKLLLNKDKALLVRWNALLDLNLCLDVVNCVR